MTRKHDHERTDWTAAPEIRRRRPAVAATRRRHRDVHESAMARASGWFLVPPRG